MLNVSCPNVNVVRARHPDRNTRKKFRGAARVACLIPMLWSNPTLAWGPEGHQIVALIASRNLSARARHEVLRLLGGTDVASAMMMASTWADDIRASRPDTAPWHFVNIEINSTGYDQVRDCAEDNCVVGQISRDRRLLADPTLLPVLRGEALKFLIHFVGDIHQPLHCADNHDRGGNAMAIELNGQRLNIHSLWDFEMVEQLGDDPKTVSSEIERHVSLGDQTMRPEIWADQSFAIAKGEIYAKFGTAPLDGPLVVTQSYLAEEAPTVRRQLKRAGLRLAMLINQAFAH